MPALAWWEIRSQPTLPPRFHLLISDPSLMFLNDSVQHYWISLDQNMWTNSRLCQGRITWVRPGQGWRSVSLCSSLKALVALMKILALIWVNVALTDSIFSWPGWIIFQSHLALGLWHPHKGQNHSGHSRLCGMYAFHLYQECHVAFPDCISNLLPHLSFQTKYRCSSHMCLWYIINLHLS